MTLTVDTTTEPVNLRWYAGDSSVQTFRCVDAIGQPVDLASYTITSKARSTLGETTPLTVYVPDPAAGVLSLHAPAKGLDRDLYDYDVQFATGDTVSSWIHGRIQVLGDVTP
jgi:hypothetical protein